eukprot:8028913-Alexandrium_andersonii.AAC.1
MRSDPWTLARGTSDGASHTHMHSDFLQLGRQRRSAQPVESSQRPVGSSSSAGALQVGRWCGTRDREGALLRTSRAWLGR